MSSKLEHLRDLKRQTWAITNYALLLYGAIFAVFKEAHHKAADMILAADIAIGTIAVGGSLLLLVIQRDLGIARLAINKNDKDPYWRGWQFLVALVAALWGGAWLLWISLPYL